MGNFLIKGTPIEHIAEPWRTPMHSNQKSVFFDIFGLTYAKAVPTWGNYGIYRRIIPENERLKIQGNTEYVCPLGCRPMATGTLLHAIRNARRLPGNLPRYTIYSTINDNTPRITPVPDSPQDLPLRDFVERSYDPKWIFVDLQAGGGQGGNSGWATSASGGGGGAYARILINLDVPDFPLHRYHRRIERGGMGGLSFNLYDTHNNSYLTPFFTVNSGATGSNGSDSNSPGGTASLPSSVFNSYGIYVVQTINGGAGGARNKNGASVTGNYVETFTPENVIVSYGSGSGGLRGGNTTGDGGGGGGSFCGNGGNGASSSTDGGSSTGYGAGGGGAYGRNNTGGPAGKPSIWIYY